MASFACMLLKLELFLFQQSMSRFAWPSHPVVVCIGKRHLALAFSSLDFLIVMPMLDYSRLCLTCLDCFAHPQQR